MSCLGREDAPSMDAGLLAESTLTECFGVHLKALRGKGFDTTKLGVLGTCNPDSRIFQCYKYMTVYVGRIS